jgi:MYXO-CTERM domain-containing protein
MPPLLRPLVRSSRFPLIGLLLLGAFRAGAVPTSVTSQDSPNCDVLSVPALVEELGNPASPPFGSSGPFPADSAIASTSVGSGEVLCDPGDQGFGAVLRITNLTTKSFDNVWYVGDSSVAFNNYDGMINGTFAVKIDAVGVNQPLIAESIAFDGIFAPGEAWDFVLAGFDDVCGRSATLFGSIGVPSEGGLGEECSGEFPPPDGSTGSIIATPEPGALGLVGLGLLALTIVRRRG